MRVAIDVSPLISGHFLQHRVRGTGSYLRNLKDSLVRYFPENDYIFFKKGEKIPERVEVTHYPYFEPYFITLPIKKSGKTVVTVHDLTPLVFRDKFPAGIKGVTKWVIQKMLLSRTDAIITDSFSSKKDIINFTKIPDNKIHVVYLAAGEEFRPRNKKIIKKFEIPENFLLYVGDVTWNKNLPNLIRAVSKSGHHLVIAGKAFKDTEYDRSNPWNQDLLISQSLTNNNNKIIPIGFVETEDLVDLYNMAQAFIMPSFYEGFGLPALEAMQSGCPVITSKKGSLPEVAGEAAYFIDPYDIDSIASGITKIMGNIDIREDLSRKGLEQAKKFSWKKTAEETIKVYNNVAEGNY